MIGVCIFILRCAYLTELYVVVCFFVAFAFTLTQATKALRYPASAGRDDDEDEATKAKKNKEAKEAIAKAQKERDAKSKDKDGKDKDGKKK